MPLEQYGDLKGMKCQAPLKEVLILFHYLNYMCFIFKSWGTALYHNAMIHNRLEGGDGIDFNAS